MSTEEQVQTAVIEASKSGKLAELLKKHHLFNLVTRLVRMNPNTGTHVYEISGVQYDRLMAIYADLGLTHPTRFRESKDKSRYTFSTGWGYDWKSNNLLGGSMDGRTANAFRAAGLSFD